MLLWASGSGSGDRPVSQWERHLSLGSACDRGCSSEAGWGSAICASGRVGSNGRCSEPYHFLGCVSSVYDPFHEVSWPKKHGNAQRVTFAALRMRLGFDRSDGVFWEA